MNIYAWIYIAGLGAGFFAPISGIFIKKYELVPTIRVLYLLFLVVMTIKIFLTFKYTTETKQGKVRMEETKHISIKELLSGYGGVIRNMINMPQTMYTLGLMIIMSICNMINNTFWSLNVTERIHISEHYIGIFPFIRSIVMLLFFFTIVPRINALNFKRPMTIGFTTFAVSQCILILTPEKGYAFLVISILLEAYSLSIVNPLIDSLQVVMIDPQERARIIAVLFVIVIALTSPFGWIAGILSGIDRRLPFVLNIILLILGLILTFMAANISKEKTESLSGI